MTLGIDHMLPRWLIDDTSDICNARIFVVHTQEPRFVGELMPEAEADAADVLDRVVISRMPGEQIVTRILWLDDPPFFDDDFAADLAGSLAEAIHRHDAVRSTDDFDTRSNPQGH